MEANKPLIRQTTSKDPHKPQTSNPANVPTPPGSYDQLCITPILPTSKLITVAGQTGLDPISYAPSTIFEEQVARAYVSVENCLKAAGATPRDIVFVRHYIVDKTGDPEVDHVEVVERGWARLWEEFMDREGGGHRPPDTVLGVAALAKKGLLYEVEVMAVLHD